MIKVTLQNIHCCLFFLLFEPFHAGAGVNYAEGSVGSGESLCASRLMLRCSLLRYRSLVKHSARPFVEYFDDLVKDSKIFSYFNDKLDKI